MDIEKEFKNYYSPSGDPIICTENGELYKDEEGTLFTIIIDQELDPIVVLFDYDGGARFITENYTHINIHSRVLMMIACLVDDAEDYYKNNTYE